MIISTLTERIRNTGTNIFLVLLTLYAVMHSNYFALITKVVGTISSCQGMRPANEDAYIQTDFAENTVV